MDNLFQQALALAEIGIIIVDSDFRILLWNKYIERISDIKRKDATNKKLQEVCPVFSQPRYQEMLHAAVTSQQCRFCSSKIHKAFIYPQKLQDDSVRQNMALVPLVSEGEAYILIQVMDISYQVTSEHKLASLLSEMTRGYYDIKESEELNKMLAATDALTGLYNRMALLQNINRIIYDKLEDEKYALIFLDLDSFKTVNDTLGHSTGDKLIVKVAERLLINVRYDDLVARLGGDEFVVLFKVKNGLDSIHTVAKKLLSEISKPIVIEGNVLHITCSIGVVLLHKDFTADEILAKADKSMYESKKAGKNTYTIFSDENS